jgi:hypothetical protein
MNKNFEFLKTNFPEYFKNKTISDGFVSKIFTFVDDKHQYIFINHWENVITRALETDFYEFLVKKYNANCYSRGSLSINEDEEQFISLIFV